LISDNKNAAKQSDNTPAYLAQIRARSYLGTSLFPMQEKFMKRSWSVLATLFAVTTISAAAPAFAAGDAAAGEKVFNQCKSCHSAQAGKNMVGPSLFAVVGRKAGSVDGFKYSDPVKASGVTWDAASLDKWLTSPKDFIAGNKMPFPGVKDATARENLIAYLETVK